MCQDIHRRVRFYIDGFNLYHAIEKLNKPRLKWLSIRALCQTFLCNNEILDEINFFTAIWKYDQAKQRRHENYLAALRATDIKVHEGHFKRPDKYCYTQNRYCRFREEKQTDVAIAVKLVGDAIARHMGRAVLLTADSDQIPVAKFVNGLDQIRLSLVYPPGRAKQARELGNYIPDRREITEGILRACPLPRTVHDADGNPVAFMPVIYV